MKILRPSAPAYAWLLLASLPGLRAAEAVQLETVLYVFKDPDFARISLAADEVTGTGRGIVFRSPVTLTFDHQILALNGARYAWNGDQPAPASFSEMALPGIVTPFGQAAMVLCNQPVQYLEKAADGSLHVREIGQDSPEVPHYRLTVTVQAGASAAGYVVACALDIATVTGREKIPGVELDAGKPILARLKDTLRFPVSAGEWSGILLRRPSGSDYSLVMLMKASPYEPAAGAPIARPPEPASVVKPAGDTLAVALAIAANGVTDLVLGVDRKTQNARRVTREDPGVRFGLKLHGRGPVYRQFEVSRHGPAASSVPHLGTVTIDPKHQWVVIDLQEVVSKPGEPRRTEPCGANGRYPVESVTTGPSPAGYDPASAEISNPAHTLGSGPTPAELAVPIIPNGPPMAPR